MNLLFVHDVKAREYDGEIFARSYGYDVWKERYLTSFEKVTVCCRVSKSEADLNGKVDKATGPNVVFDKRIKSFFGPDVFFSRRIKKILRENINNSEAVIVRLDSFLGLQTIYECRKSGKPYLIELVGCAWDSFWNHGISGKILAPYLFLRTKKEVKRAPFVVYVTSKFLQKRYPTLGENTNISNVQLDVQGPEVLESRIKKTEENNGKIVLGTAANVNIRYKGMQFVIEALGILKKQGYDNFEYQLLGQGDNSYLKKVAELNGVQDKVTFLGSYPHEKVFDWLKSRIDVYIQPSLQEGLPRSVIEAMSVGLPCIGSDVAGIPELLDENWVFKRRGNKAKAISELLKALSVEELKQQSYRNFDEAAKYDYQVLLKKRKDIFERFKAYIKETL